jgi:hypothetical protein
MLDKHGEGRNAFKVFVRSLKGSEQSEDLNVSKNTLKERDIKMWTGFICLRIGTSSRLL